MAKQKNPQDYITPLNMNRLEGRMLRLPAPKNKRREILLIYGHHATLERLFGLAEVLNDYGAVTMPDLPGFGGMDSFYKIGEKPSLNNMADYLAAFIKMRYKNRRITIVGYSFGFLVVTRMLQRYPDLAKKTDLLISGVGFAHYEDFRFKKPRYLFYRWGASLFSNYLPSLFFRYFILNSIILRLFYARTHNAKHKFEGMDSEQRKIMTDFEVHLWHANDARTYADTTVTLLTANNCISRVDLPVWHAGVKSDNYFDNKLVEQHMRLIFNDFHVSWIKLAKHSMTVIASKKESMVFLPSQIRCQLNRKLP